MASHFPIVFEQEESGAYSAYVAGLPVYAQGRTRAQATGAIVRTLRAYLVAHPQEQPRAEVQVAKVSAPTNRLARPKVNLLPRLRSWAAVRVCARRRVRVRMGTAAQDGRRVAPRRFD